MIILADMNNNICIDPIQTAVIQMGLAEAITTQHGPNTPNMHNHRSKPIDGIFLEPNLIQTISSGYLAFGKGIPSDHWAVWINIPIGAMGWFMSPDAVLLKARQLKCEDPRIVAKYNLMLEMELTSQNLPCWMESLVEQVKGHRLTWAQQRKLENIDRETTCTKVMAEWNCQKLTLGKVQWCPQLTKAIACILYWKGIKKESREEELWHNIWQDLLRKAV